MGFPSAEGRAPGNLARVVLLLSAAPFTGVGIAFLLAPAGMGALVGVSLAGATADNDVRAVYGGLQLGCAVFLTWCAFVPEWRRPGVAAQLCTFGGLAAARIVSWLFVGFPDSLGLALHIGELVGIAAGVVAWRSLAVDVHGRSRGSRGS